MALLGYVLGVLGTDRKLSVPCTMNVLYVLNTKPAPAVRFAMMESVDDDAQTWPSSCDLIETAAAVLIRPSARL
jgi:hypothetical protein